MPFLLPNQQCQSTEGKYRTTLLLVINDNNNSISVYLVTSHKIDRQFQLVVIDVWISNVKLMPVKRTRVVKTARFLKPVNREKKDRLTVFTYLVYFYLLHVNH